MTRKRSRHDQRADSSLPDAESLSGQKGDTSCRPSDWMPVVKQFLDVFVSIRDELRGIAQVNTTVHVLADKLSTLDEKVENILTRGKEELKEEIKAVVKLELQGSIQLDNNQNESKVIPDDYAKAPDCGDASPLRSQPHQSQQPRFRLNIKSTIRSPCIKGKPLQTEDGEEGIEVEMLDGGNPIAPGHPLASVKLNLVLVNPELYHGISGKMRWSEDDFRNTLWNPGNAKLLKHDTFKLKGGRAIQPVTITQGTVRKEVQLGVMLEELGPERVREGVSNRFRVQEPPKTANREKNKELATNGTAKMFNALGQAPSWNDQQYLPKQHLSQPMQHDSRQQEGSATYHTTKDFSRHTGESLQQPTCKIEDPLQERLPHLYDAQSSHPQAMPQSSSHLASTPTEGNGGRISGQQYSQQIMMPTRFVAPNRSQIVQNGNDPIGRPQQQYTNPLATTQQHHRGSGRGGQVSGPYGQHYQGQGQVMSSPYHFLPSSSLLPINDQIVGNGQGGPFIRHHSEQQLDTTYQQVNKVGQGGLNSHQHHNFQQKSLFPATHPQPAAGQVELNSQQHHSLQKKSLFPETQAQPMDLDMNMPYSSTSQINAPERDSWPCHHTQIGGNGSDLDMNRPYSSTSQINDPQRESWNFHHNQIGENDNFQLGATQMLAQPTNTQVVKHGQGQFNLQHQHIQEKSLFPTTHSQPMGQAENSHQQVQPAQPQILRETGPGQVVSSPHLILPPSSLPTINAQSLGQQDNFQQAQRQILPQDTTTEAMKHGQGQLNSQNLFPSMPLQTTGCFGALVSEVNPPQNSSQLPINHSSGPTEENYGSSQTMWQDSLLYGTESDCEFNENHELLMTDLGNVLENGLPEAYRQ